MFRSTAKAIFQSDESSPDDTDEDFSENLANCPKKRRKALTGSTLTLQRGLSEESGNGAAPATSKTAVPQSPRMAKKASGRKVNTVWSDLAAEEQLISGLDGSLQVKKQKRGLGVESYAFDPSIFPQHSRDERHAERRNSGTSAEQECEAVAEKSSQDSEDSTKEAKVNEPKNDETQGDEDQKVERKKSTRNFRKRRLLTRYKQKFPMNFHIRITPDDKKFDPNKKEDEEKLRNFVDKLCQALHEHKRDLLDRCVKNAGVDKCAQLLHKTWGIEKYGGWLTVDEQRRRTPGGVFLTLLKQDEELTDEMHKAIFGLDKEEKAAEQRKILSAKRTTTIDGGGGGGKKNLDTSFEKSLLALKRLAEERKIGGAEMQVEKQEGESSNSGWKTRAELHLEECSISKAFLEKKVEDSNMEQQSSSSSEDD